jgi:hypothetical protein
MYIGQANALGPNILSYVSARCKNVTTDVSDTQVRNTFNSIMYSILKNKAQPTEMWSYIVL